jgi:hypothetical protein
MSHTSDRPAPGLAWLLGLAACATSSVALWLFVVSLAVLPSRDPDHVVVWQAIAAAFLTFSLLSWTAIGARAGRAIRVALAGSALLAIAAGCFAIGRMVFASGGGHFEGYLLIMGIALSAHGVLAAAYAWRGGLPQDSGPPAVSSVATLS